LKRLAISTIVVLNLISTITLGQFFNPGQERYGQKWRQIQTSNFRVIYPASVEEQALQTASYLESIRDSVQLGLHHGTRRIPVVLHPNSILSNGFVSWAPKRMELVTTPAFDGYQGNWLNSVASHELRHVVQIDKLNNRFTRVLYFLFGEQVVGGVTAFVPTWFLEGDAVYAETEISVFGRGREPQFLQQFRADFLTISCCLAPISTTFLIIISLVTLLWPMAENSMAIPCGAICLGLPLDIHIR